jgi:hypothetical protein
VFGFAFCVSYSEYLNAGYNEAQNLMFDMLTWVIFPYILGKGLIEPHNLAIPFAKRLVFLMFIISIVSVYEFKMGVTPWKLVLQRFSPWQGEGWVTTFRFIHSMRSPPAEPRGSCLGFTLLGIYVAFGFSIATVYMGGQVIPLFFLMTGWSEGYLLSGRESTGALPTQAAYIPPFRFQRVMV